MFKEVKSCNNILGSNNFEAESFKLLEQTNVDTDTPVGIIGNTYFLFHHR
jgi:hypothetical protein